MFVHQLQFVGVLGIRTQDHRINEPMLYRLSHFEALTDHLNNAVMQGLEFYFTTPITRVVYNRTYIHVKLEWFRNQSSRGRMINSSASTTRDVCQTKLSTILPKVSSPEAASRLPETRTRMQQVRRRHARGLWRVVARGDFSRAR